MSARQKGPPESEMPAHKEPAPTTTPTVDSDHTTAPDRRPAFDALAGNARRYGASRRMAPLPPCGCVRDPEYDRHVCGGEISDNARFAT
jgi:hypothetical protein